MSDGQPDAGVGRDIRMEIGRFECVCGNVVIEPKPLDNTVKLVAGLSKFPFGQDTLDCDDCGREWAIVDDGVHWESRGGDDK